MILTVDVGNSNIVAGVYDRDTLLTHWRLSTRPYRTGDELLVTLRALFSESSILPEVVRSVVVSSVVPPLTEPLVQSLRSLCGVIPFLVTPSSVPWLEIGTDSREEMGPDLVANAVAAGAISAGRAASVVDFGTALTITTIDENACVQGVSIAPGLGQASLALSTGTAQLPQVALEAPERPFGTNTVSAIQAGLVHGYAAMVEGMITKLEAYFDTRITGLATGGLSDIVAPLIPQVEHVDPWLTLNGLRLIAERNEAQ
ncbi:MAG: type III pantothenate kinase [Spirochaetales bacterium]